MLRPKTVVYDTVQALLDVTVRIYTAGCTVDAAAPSWPAETVALLEALDDVPL